MAIRPCGPLLQTITIAVALLCSACIQLPVYILESQGKSHDELYRESNWYVMRELNVHPAMDYRGCSVGVNVHSSTQTLGHSLRMELLRDARQNRETWQIQLSVPSWDLDRFGRPAELPPKNKTSLVLIGLGAGFTRHLEFHGEDWLAFAEPADLAERDLDGLLLALQPSSGEKTVTFENGTIWRFPPPKSGDLAVKVTECMRSLRLTPFQP